MQVLNFVPNDYIQKKLARKASLLCAMLAAVVGLALTVLFVVLGMAEDSLAVQQEAVEQQVARAAKQVTEWETFQMEQAALLERAEKAAQLLVPLPRSRVLAEVVRSLPEETTLTELVVVDETLRVLESAAKSGEAPPRPGTKPKPEAKESVVTRIRMQGLAPTDVEVAQLIAALSDSAYFDQVELAYSEDRDFGEVTLRRFEVQCCLSNYAYRLSWSAGERPNQSGSTLADGGGVR